MNYKEEIQKLQGQIESLRSDMEQGKIRIRVSKDLVFRQELAKAIASDYAKTLKKGWHYAQPCTGKVVFKEGGFSSAEYNSSSVLVVPVIYFMGSDPNQFTVEEWESAVGKEIFQTIVSDWHQRIYIDDEGLDLKESLDYFLGNALDWALANPKYSSIVQKADEHLQEKLIQKIIPLIKDELLLKVPNDFGFLEKQCDF